MRSFTTIALVLMMAAPAVAFDGVGSQQYFTPNERTSPTALGLSSIGERYPRPASIASRLNIPNGAGAPVPVNAFALPRPYALGEAAVPFGTVQATVDAKGRATHDVRGTTAWDGVSSRMTFGY